MSTPFILYLAYKLAMTQVDAPSASHVHFDARYSPEKGGRLSFDKN